MNCNILQILKAAFFCAAFSFSAEARTNMTAFEGVKQKATELLMQKKKNQAIQLLLNYSKLETGKTNKAEINELLINMAQKFIFKDAQDAYENSLNLTLDNPKEAARSNDQCLAIEPQQLDCLIQKMRLYLRTKNIKAAEKTLNEVKEIVPGSKYEVWLGLMLTKAEADFKNKQVLKNIPDRSSEEGFALSVLELERSFFAKNYARAKEFIAYLEKHYPEWPDNLYYRYKINLESSEEKIKANPEELVLYANKCKSLTRSVARKFRYDFELCLRGVE